MKGFLRWGTISLVVIFWGVYIWQNWSGFLTYGWQLDFTWLALSFLTGFVYWVSLAAIWQRALVAAGGSLGLRRAGRLWAMSMLARYVPGGVWHIAGRVYLAAQAGESRVAVFVSTVVEQALYLAAATLVFLISLPFWHADYIRLLPVLFLALPLALVLLSRTVLRRLGVLAVRVAGRKRGGEEAASLAGESLSPPSYGALLVLLALYVLPNLMGALSLYLSAAAVGPVSPGQLPAFVGACAIGWILGYFSFFAPSGLGVREGVVSLLLAPVVGFPVAVAASILSRLVMSASEVAFVGVCWAERGKGERES